MTEKSAKYLHRIVSLIFDTQRLIMEGPRANHRLDVFSFLQLQTLRFVREKEYPQMHEIADFLRVTPPSATSLINGLVKCGQLKRVPDPKDRRVVRLALTVTGQRTLKKGIEHISGHIERVFKRLSERERKHLISILEELAKNYHNK